MGHKGSEDSDLTLDPLLLLHARIVTQINISPMPVQDPWECHGKIVIFGPMKPRVDPLDDASECRELQAVFFCFLKQILTKCVFMSAGNLCGNFSTL